MGLNTVMSEIIEAKDHTRLEYTIAYELWTYRDCNSAFVRSDGLTAHDQS